MMGDSKFSHEDLRRAAVKWLTNSRHCGAVLCEIVTYAGEIPDAIGWRNDGSILIECKVSRSDFHANADKCHTRTNSGVGNYRYFLIPDDLLKEEEMEGWDHCKGWGLLSLSRSGRQVGMVKKAEYRETNHRNEILMLLSALRRVKTREFLTIVQERQGDSVCA